MTEQHTLIRWVAGILCGIAVFVQPASAQGRGESLYSTHCGACHTAQMHWRANGAVKDWASLKGEVRKWQAVASLAWTEDEVLDVARYLNDNIYHFEQTDDRLSSAASRT
jgi:mono/diheme cytochrome c family protein